MNKIISEVELSPFITGDGLDYAVKALLSQQKSTWAQLKKGYDSLNNTEIKVFEFNDFKIKIQFNKERMLSASAKVDKDSVNNRKCFLCRNNLPKEQKGIKFNEKFLILANPFPIFPEHFTIASLEHEPQRIFNHFEDMLLLTQKLGRSYVVFYNGPASGASAPDHLHFQAGNLGFLPIDYEKDKLIGKNILTLKVPDKLEIFYSKNYLRNFVILKSDNSKTLVEAFQKILNILNKINPNEDETKLNIIGYYKDRYWEVFIFPREKHRPDFYYFNEPERIILSPAAVDLGGVCILPRKNDFKRISKELLIKAFGQVTLSNSKYNKLLALLEN